MHEIKNEAIEWLRRNDVLRLVLLLGKTQDLNLDIEKHLNVVLGIAAKVWNRASRHRSTYSKLECLNYTLYGDFGIQVKNDRVKNIIEDPNRILLHRVMDQKVTSPLTMAVLYYLLAEQIGVRLQVVALPSSFLLKLNENGEDAFIDPSEGGKRLSVEEFHRRFKTSAQRHQMIHASLYEVLDSTQLVGRLAQALKQVYILKGSAIEALRTVDILTTLFPESPELTRDRGILYCEIEYFSKAMEDLQSYLKLRPRAEDRKEIQKLTSMLRGYREIIN